MSGRADDLRRIAEALDRAREVLADYTPGAVASRSKSPGDPVTEADLRVNDLLRRTLPGPGEGWLSEESADDADRLGRERVWVVDPLDGTREFVAGIPEWAVSIGLVERGRAVAGGVAIPGRALTVTGAAGEGIEVNGAHRAVRERASLEGAEVLASRSEVGRGEWRRFEGAPFRFRPHGSAASKLALVAAGEADATFTLVPKHEWDVAAGVALVIAAGGRVWLPGAGEPAFNRPRPLLPGLVAASAAIAPALRALLAG